MTYRFAIIGAGIAGASAAYELAAYGSVIILERESSPAYHTTGRSAAIFIPNYGNDVVRALTAASKAFFESPPMGYADHPLLSPSGVLIIGKHGSEEAMDEEAKSAQRLMPWIRRLDSKEAIALVPILRREWVAGGIYNPTAPHMDVDAIHQGYLRGVSARGGIVRLNAEITALNHNGNHWRIAAGAEIHEAEIIINAAGAWADVIGKMAGTKSIGLMPKKRTAAIVRFPDGVDGSRWPVVAAFDESFYFKPEAGKLLISPADEIDMPPCDAYPEDYDIAVTLDRIQQAADLPVTRVERSWAGLRSFVADRSPVVGYDPQAPNFFWCAGQGGVGIQTAPAMGRATAALAVSGNLPDDLIERGITSIALSPVRL